MRKPLLIGLCFIAFLTACDQEPQNKPEPTPPVVPITPDKPKNPNESDKPGNKPVGEPTPTKVLTAADITADMLKDGVLTLPKDYAEIAANALKGRNDITRLVAPNLIKIGTEAFRGCKNLRELVLPKARDLGNKSFYECSALRRIDLPAVERIEVGAFSDCLIVEELLIPSIKHIGSQAFYAMLRLKKVQMGTTAPEASDDAFKFCTVAKVLSVTEGRSGAFTSFANKHRFARIEGGTALQANFSPQPSGMRVNGETIERFEDSGAVRLIDFVLNPKYKRIGERAFWETPSLHDLFAASGVEEVGNYGLQDCTNIIALDLPKVKKLGEEAIQGCSRLTYVNIPLVEQIGAKAFELSYRITHLQIPMVKSIGDEAFADCQKLVEIELGATPPTMGNNVFGRTAANYAIKADQITLIVPKGAKSAYDGWTGKYTQIGRIVERE